MNTKIVRFFLSDSHQKIEVELRSSPRAKRYILKRKFTSQNFVLTIPKHGSHKQALEFLNRSSGWMNTQLKKAPRLQSHNELDIVKIFDENYKILSNQSLRGATSHYTAEDGEKIIQVAGNPEHRVRRIKDYLKRLALQEFSESVQFYTKKLGKTYVKIRLSDPKTRWGSCSSNGTLCFSWRIIMAPRSVLSYLVAHEVAHLKHMNHSAKFWHTVEELDPNWRNAELWLKKNGTQLHMIL